MGQTKFEVSSTFGWPVSFKEKKTEWSSRLSNLKSNHREFGGGGAGAYFSGPRRLFVSHYASRFCVSLRKKSFLFTWTHRVTQKRRGLICSAFCCEFYSFSSNAKQGRKTQLSEGGGGHSGVFLPGTKNCHQGKNCSMELPVIWEATETQRPKHSDVNTATKTQKSRCVNYQF